MGATAAPARCRAPAWRTRSLAVARDKILGARDHFDHALVGFARAVAERDDAVFAQDQPSLGFARSKTSIAFFASPKPGIR